MKLFRLLPYKMRWFLLILLFLCGLLTVSARAATLTLPSGLKQIEAQAFYGDKKLNNVVLPEGLQSIGDKAFANSGLKSIHLPSSVTYIADDAFAGTKNLRITAEEDSYAYDWLIRHDYLALSGKGMLLYEDSAYKQEYPCNMTLEFGNDQQISLYASIISERLFVQAVSNGMTKFRIYLYALNEAPDYNDPTQIQRRVGDFILDYSQDATIEQRLMLQSYINSSPYIKLDPPANATYLKMHLLFYSDPDAAPTAWACYGFHFVDPAKETTVGDFNFRRTGRDEAEVADYIGNSTSVVIPDQDGDGRLVTKIGNASFKNNDSITHLIIPENITEIGDQAFNGCNSLKNVVLAEGVASIGANAFANTNLKSIYLPTSLHSIDPTAFSNCHGTVGFGPTGTTASSFFESADNLVFRSGNLLLSNTVWKTQSAVSGYRRNNLVLSASAQNGEVTWENNNNQAVDMITTSASEVIILPKNVSTPQHAVISAKSNGETSVCDVYVYDRPVLTMNGRTLGYGEKCEINPVALDESVSISCSSSDPSGVTVSVTAVSAEPDLVSEDEIKGTTLTKGTDYSYSDGIITFTKTALNAQVGKWLVITASAYDNTAVTRAVIRIYKMQFTVTMIDNLTAKLKWDLLPNAAYYTIIVNSAMSETSGAVSFTVDTQTAPNGTYHKGKSSTGKLYYWCYANLNDGSRVRIGFVYGPAGKGNPNQQLKLSGLHATEVSPYRIKLSWNKDTNGTLQSYRVTYWKAGDTQHKLAVESGKSNTITVKNLIPETEYCFTVVGSYANGDVSADSDVCTISTKRTNEMELRKPENISFSFTREYITTGNWKLNISFTPVGPAAEYSLWVSETPLREASMLCSEIGNYTGTGEIIYSWTIDAAAWGLEEDVPYYFWINAASEDNEVVAGPYRALAAIVDDSQNNQPMIQYATMPSESVVTGDEVSLTVTSLNCDRIQMMVDGIFHNEYGVVNNVTTIVLPFHKGGDRLISFKPMYLDKTGKEYTAGYIHVLSDGPLDAPNVSVSGAMVQSGQVFVRWQHVENAENYNVYLRYEGTRIDTFTVTDDGSTDYTCELKRNLLQKKGTYSVEVIAYASGYSQKESSVDFTIKARTNKLVWSSSPTISICNDDLLQNSQLDLSSKATLTQIYSDGKVTFIEYTLDDLNGTGWVAADMLSNTKPEFDIEMQVRYKRTNRYDINCDVTITMTGSSDIKYIRILDGQMLIKEQGDPSAVSGNSDLVRIIADIPPVTELTAYTIQGLDENKDVIKTTTLHVDKPSVQISDLGTPDIEECAPITQGVNTRIHWQGVSGAQNYILRLEKDNQIKLSDMKLSGQAESYLIPGTALDEVGTYKLTLQAQKTENGNPVTGNAAVLSLEVVASSDIWYLSGKTYHKYQSYGVLTYLEPFRITYSDPLKMTIEFVDRTGKAVTWHDLSRQEFTFAKQMYKPKETVELRNNRLLTGLSSTYGSSTGSMTTYEGNSLYMIVQTNHVAKTVEVLEDGVHYATLSPSHINEYCLTWAVPFSVSAGTHTYQAIITGADGSIVKTELLQVTGNHTHTARTGTTVLPNQMVITERGIECTDAVCSICGEHMGHCFVKNEVALPNSMTGFIFTGNLQNTNASVQISNDQNILIKAGVTVKLKKIQTNGDIYIEKGASLSAESISCRNMNVHGTLSSTTVTATKMTIEYNGILKMNSSTRVSVQDFCFNASDNHSTYLTGGELFISGDMTVRGRFEPTSKHKTIFSANSHKLYNSWTTKFGILVLNCSISKFAAQSGFDYDYAVFPNEDRSRYEQGLIQPVMPENVKKYQDVINSDSKLRERITSEKYDEKSNVDFIFSGEMGYFTISCTTNNTMLQGSKYKAKVEEVAVNALNDYINYGRKQDMISKILEIVQFSNSIQRGSYQLNGSRVMYEGSVTCNGGTATTSSVMAMLTVRYKEWLDNKPETVYSNTYTLLPEHKLTSTNIKTMMQQMSWIGKEKCDELVEEAYNEIKKDSVGYLTAMSGYEKGAKVAKLCVTLLDGAEALGTQGQPAEPLVSVYTDKGMLYVSKAYNKSLPLSEACNECFRVPLEGLLNN